MNFCLVDGRISGKMEAGLLRCGFHAIKLAENARLSPAVSSHTDMLVFRLGTELFSTAEYCEDNEELFLNLRRLLPTYTLRFTSDEQSAEYPRDVSLNALVLGKKIFARIDSLSEDIIRRAKELGYELVGVNQGYPACTVLKLNDGAVITQDRGMASILLKHGIRVTLIEEGDISLPPHPYGFIGGAGGVFRDTLYLLGDVEAHKSCEKIRRAAKEEGLAVVSLAVGEMLTDLGGIVFFENDVK